MAGAGRNMMEDDPSAAFIQDAGKTRQCVCPENPASARDKIRLALIHRRVMIAAMTEVEVYAAGVRQPEKMLGLALELDVIPNLRYKVDTNHDIVYMEFGGEAPTLGTLESVFRKISLAPRFVGQLSLKQECGKTTQRIY